MGEGYGGERRRRVTLTPLQRELRPEPQPRPPRRRPVRALLARLRRRPPTTTRGAVAWGLVRLAVVLAAATGVAALLVRWWGRDWAVAFYLQGALVLTAALLLAANDEVDLRRELRVDRQAHMRSSLAYVLIGLVLIGIGVALETR